MIYPPAVFFFTNMFCTLNKYILQFGQIHFQSWAVLEEWKGANCLINFFSRQFNPVADLCVWKLLLKYREEIELNIEFLWVALIVYKSISVWNFPFTKIGHNAAISALVFKYEKLKAHNGYVLLLLRVHNLKWFSGVWSGVMTAWLHDVTRLCTISY